MPQTVRRVERQVSRSARGVPVGRTAELALQRPATVTLLYAGVGSATVNVAGAEITCGVQPGSDSTAR